MSVFVPAGKARSVMPLMFYIMSFVANITRVVVLLFRFQKCI